VLVGDVGRNPQAQTGAFGLEFGGVERGAHLLHAFLGYSGTLVGHLDNNPPGRLVVAGKHGDGAVAVGQGLAGVLDQVDQDLLDALEVAGDRRQVAVQQPRFTQPLRDDRDAAGVPQVDRVESAARLPRECRPPRRNRR